MYAVRRAKRRAALRNIDFDLTWEDLVPPKKCPVLGIPLVIGDRTRPGIYNSPSLDRIDNSKGYTKDNVQVISYRANSIKSDATPEEIKRIYKYIRLNNRSKNRT